VTEVVTFLVYRDRIMPRSEAPFMRRMYVGFDRLKPVWVGRHRGDGLAELGVEPLWLGHGIVDRALFKHFGRLPAVPDLRALNPRLVHAQFGRGGALALPIARALGIPLVVTFHGGDATKEGHYRRRLFPTIYQRRLAALQREAALFVCVSDFIRDRLVERGFPPEKLRVIRLGIDMPGEQPVGPPAATGGFVFAGRFVEKKGLPDLIEAMRSLAGQGSRARLVLIGDGPLMARLKAQAASLDTVSFTGWLPYEEVRRHMRGALAVCVPSVTAPSGDMEGLPGTVIEAMASGTPVIATRHSGIVEAIEDGRTGLLVPSGDRAALAAAMRRLFDDPAAARAMGEVAQVVAAARFNAMTQSRLLQETLLGVIAAR